MSDTALAHLAWNCPKCGMEIPYLTSDKYRPNCLQCGVAAVRPDTPPSMRERLARAAADSYFVAGWDGEGQADRALWFHTIDAILTELQEPSIGLVRACIGPMKSDDEEQAGRTWQAGIQHIKDGGQ